MKKILAILLIASALSTTCKAWDSTEGKRMFYGLEWGAGILFSTHDNCVFMTEDGYIIDFQLTRFTQRVRGSFSLFGGCRLTEAFDVSLHAGIEGLAPGIRVFPLAARLAYTIPSAPVHSFFASAGAGIPEHGLRRTAYMFRLGYAHNIDIGYSSTLRFSVCGKAAYAHPSIYDRHADRYVPEEDVRLSDSIYTGAEFSIALVF